MVGNAEVTLVRRVVVGRDGDGNDVYGDDPESPVVVAVFAPGGSSEVTAGRDTVITQPTVYLPAGLGVKAIDVVLVGSDRYEVDGDPDDWTFGSPFTGWVPPFPVVAKLRKVTG